MAFRLNGERLYFDLFPFLGLNFCKSEIMTFLYGNILGAYLNHSKCTKEPREKDEIFILNMVVS